MDVLWNLKKTGRSHANLCNLSWICKERLTLALEPLLVNSYSLRELMNDTEGLHRLENSQRLGIVEKIADALQFLHRHQFCHNDVRPANIIVGADPKNDVLLADFGQACHFSNQQPKPITDKSVYMPPEALLRQSVAMGGEVRDLPRSCNFVCARTLSSRHDMPRRGAKVSRRGL